MRLLAVFLFVLLFGCNTDNNNTDNNTDEYKIVAYKELLSSSPDKLNNYIVLSKKNFPEVKQWKLTFIPSKVSERNTRKEVVLDKGQNYYSLQKSHFSAIDSLIIEGLDENLSPVVISSPSDMTYLLRPGPDWNGRTYELVEDCKWTCNGKTYAYTILYWRDVNSESSYYLSVVPGIYDCSEGICTPEYYYMNESAFQNFCATTSNWSDIAVGCPDPVGNSIIGPLNGNSAAYHSPTGGILTGLVYGVEKGFGVWDGADIHTSLTNPLIGNPCGNQFDFILDKINQYGDFTNNAKPNENVPPLECDAISLTTGGSNGANDPSFNCISSFYGYGGLNDENPPFWGSFDKYLSCLRENGVGPTSWSKKTRLIIRDINSPDNEPIDIDLSDDIKTRELAKKIRLSNKSLYSITEVSPEGRARYFVKEMTNSF